MIRFRALPLEVVSVAITVLAACSSKPGAQGAGGTGGGAGGNTATDAGAGTGGGAGTSSDGGAPGSTCGVVDVGGASGAGGMVSGSGGSPGGGSDAATGAGGAGGPALSCDAHLCATGTVCSRIDLAAPCYDPGWAAWPMPNSFATASLPGGGAVSLPHPKSYDTTSIDGVVVDNVTGLQWQQSVDVPSNVGPGGAGGSAAGGADGPVGGAPGTDGGAGLYTWNQAKATCAGLPLGGGGWRLPTRIELVSIVDTTRFNPSINVTVFPNTPGVAFWTATPLAGSPASAWIIYLRDGSASYYDVGNRAAVRCVR